MMNLCIFFFLITVKENLEDVLSHAKIHKTNKNLNDEHSASASSSSLFNNTGEKCVESGPCNKNGTKVGKSLEYPLAHRESMVRKRKAIDYGVYKPAVYR